MSIVEHFHRFMRSENVRIFSRSVGIQVAGYAISLMLMPVSIAFYTPAQFGGFAVVLFVANFIGTYGGLRLEWALINERSGGVADLLLKFSLTLIALWGVVLAFAALVVPQTFYLQLSIGRAAAVLAAPIAVVVGYGLVLQSWGIRTKCYESVYLARNAVMVSRQVIQIGFGLLWPSVFSLLVSEFVSRSIGIRVILGRLQRRIEFVAPGRFARLFGPLVGGRYGHYSKVGLPSSLIVFLMTEGITVVIVPLYGFDVAGAYWLVRRIFGIPVALIGTVVADVFQGQIARRSDHRQISRQMMQVAVLLAAFSFTALPTAATVFWFLSQHLYGGKWLVSGQLALYLIPAVCLQFIAAPLSRVLIVREKMNYKYIFDGTLFFGLAIWLILTGVVGLPLFDSIACLAAAQTFAYGVYIALCFYTVRLV